MPKQVWSKTFDRFETGTVRIAGPVAVQLHDWGRPQEGEPRVFGDSFLEGLTFAHPRSIVPVYLPGGVALAWLGVRAGVPVGESLALYIAGLLLWSLLEYVIHRFSFHLTPRTRLQVAFGYLVHGVHHAFPDDSRRWVMPLIVTIPAGGVILGALWLILGRMALPVFGGVMHGYLTYDMVHFAIHRGTMKSGIGAYLRKHHLQHHYAVPERNFGVSSPLWDFVFRTTR